LEYLHITSADEMIKAIQTMAIRGAPAIGVAGAFALALDSRQHSSSKTLRVDLQKEAGVI
jgi:methylthioribose-1-phosphate isomerase